MPLIRRVTGMCEQIVSCFVLFLPIIWRMTCIFTLKCLIDRRNTRLNLVLSSHASIGDNARTILLIVPWLSLLHFVR